MWRKGPRRPDPGSCGAYLQAQLPGPEKVPQRPSAAGTAGPCPTSSSASGPMRLRHPRRTAWSRFSAAVPCSVARRRPVADGENSEEPGSEAGVAEAGTP